MHYCHARGIIAGTIAPHVASLLALLPCTWHHSGHYCPTCRIIAGTIAPHVISLLSLLPCTWHHCFHYCPARGIIAGTIVLYVASLLSLLPCTCHNCCHYCPARVASLRAQVAHLIHVPIILPLILAYSKVFVRTANYRSRVANSKVDNYSHMTSVKWPTTATCYIIKQ